MAIYRTGQASMDAQGYITGYDTKWREQLTLIRPGATIFFIDAPFQAAVISEVISDTQIRAITTGGAEIGRSNYIILLHDSITVDGLAQDVAETLRYYQSKETQIEEAIEFFKNFDLKHLQDLANQVKGDAEKTAEDRAATEQLKNDTQQIKDSAVAETNQIKADTNAIKEQTQQIKDSAITEVNSARDQGVLAVNQAKDQAVTDINQIKNETSNIRDEAKNALSGAESARDSAIGYANDANNAKAVAETARDEARQWAQQVNPENLLQKDQNLNDVQDKGAARAALDVPAKSESFLIENNLSEIADRTTAWLNVRPQGSTPLAGDPVNDYDAVTKRWVQNMINTGTVGPTMNGVMNYGVGDFHLRDSRAYIQPYEVASDGQLLNRADWPELWAYAQMISPIEDADWLADPANRGKYSTGDGSTTFRVPDRNGVQLNSIKGLFACGDGGGEAGQAGSISEAAAPNITGSFPGAVSGGFESAVNLYSSQRGLPGALAGENGLGLGGDGSRKSYSVLAPDNTYGFSFDASRADPVYGRHGITGTIIPNSFIGVWVIRASGGFVAANTSWSVINGDAAMPSTGTTVDGGNVCSLYKVNNVTEAEANFRARADIGGNYYARISIYNKTKNKTSSFDFSDEGDLTLPRGPAMALGDYGIGISQDMFPTTGACQFISSSDPRLAWVPTNGTGVQTAYAENRIGQIFIDNVGNVYSRFLTVSNPQTPKTSVPWVKSQAAGTSDARLKEVIGDLDVNVALANIMRMDFKRFYYLADEDKIERRGIIAQDAEKIDPEYVHDAAVTGKYSLDLNPLVLDALAAIQALSKKVEILELEIAELKTSK